MCWQLKQSCVAGGEGNVVPERQKGKGPKKRKVRKVADENEDPEDLSQGRRKGQRIEDSPTP